MSGVDIGRRTRRYLVVGTVFLVLWMVAWHIDAPGDTKAYLGLYGFALHYIFGKGYTLIPTYFESDVASPRLIDAQLPLTSLGALLLALGATDSFTSVTTLGAVLWIGGVLIFVSNIFLSIRHNITGSSTGTSKSKSELRPTDRASNLFMPVALIYLVTGSIISVPVIAESMPSIGYLGGFHLVSLGTASLMVFAVGYRLIPRFMAVTPPRASLYVVLPLGAVSPAVVAYEIPGGDYIWIGALGEITALSVFTAAVTWMYMETDRDRVGFIGVVLGCIMGMAAFTIAFLYVTGMYQDLIHVHPKATILGFLGLVIMGVTYQFYPPNVGGIPGSHDTTAFISMLLVFTGLAVELIGVSTRIELIPLLGWWAASIGVGIYAYLVFGLMVLHPRSKKS